MILAPVNIWSVLRRIKSLVLKHKIYRGGIKMSARERIAYLRGFIEGQNQSENISLSKFHEALLGAFDAITDELDDLKDYVGDVEDELMELQSEFGSDEHGNCCCCDDEDDEEEYESTCCPNCGKDFFYEPDAYDDDEDLLCPHCGEPFKQ